ncbi:helix-turn-helix domain-containing protein [Goodfellowiella coeruleoviolacea]|uniref:helix-turn-helix domain-containing protein n=1 Tax=Goodfellowiella coeruleoviolacea TaxID=334858 RepID=UPI0038996069
MDWSATLPSTSNAFGLRMRALREAKGMSLNAFAEAIHYSKGYVSRVETGRQKPSPGFARQCDAALDAEGGLLELVPSDRARRATTAPPGATRTRRHCECRCPDRVTTSAPRTHAPGPSTLVSGLGATALSRRPW